ncbi:GIY-YIG nuclease family protein [Bacteroides intestinalis]|uniref:GIY-YIG nuclease family protein n=1 Tax=Bacteroides intestinalis TaxID=329854 RepID=UPI000E5237A9|nr:GIY-YIG nuclease family protein [Bacteroides intestinalis]RHA62814.1 GIY-YIG nuclease family protein [Bacteroides intestinalis]
MSNKITIDDIFADDEFGLLNSSPKVIRQKSVDDRLVDSFEEINQFIDKAGREPSTSSMSEYSLFARLKTFRQDDSMKRTLKEFDRHNLLGNVEIDELSIDDILNDEEDYGLLDTDKELSIFRLKNVPKDTDRAETDFVAQRKPMNKSDFLKYEVMFHQVHKELKEGKRQIKPFYNIEKNLQIGGFYIADGIMLYLESADLKQAKYELKSGERFRVDGRTVTIFENGTYSNMLYRSLGKQIQKNGKLITDIIENVERNFFKTSNQLNEEDSQTGWIYVVKSKSTNPAIANIKDLYKIGFSSTPVDKRISNAKNEATYLFADVHKVASYACYNINANKLEELLDRFFASACLNVDVFDSKGMRITPREWFVVPFSVIEEVIELILNESIVHYKYDLETKTIVLK